MEAYKSFINSDKARPWQFNYIFTKKFVEGDLLKYHDDCPYMRNLKHHVCPKVDDQTMIFIYIQAFLLPEDEVTEEFILFIVSHPYWRKLL